ncbi:MAG: NAD(P)-dependent oxidoreductase [Actinomycetota bacterium]
MKVALTGHRGYVGTVLAPALIDAGHEVLGIDTDLYRHSTFGPAPSEEGITTLRRDIRDVTVDDLAGVEAVLHLAGLSNDPLGDLDPDLTDRVNREATVSLAATAKAAGVSRFVFSSSCSNYGAGVDSWLTEESAFNPQTPYGRSKVDAEAGLHELADDDFSPTYLRSGTAYGFSPRLRFDLVINNLTAWASCTGAVMLKSDGSPWRPVVHVRDMSAAFVSTLDVPREVVHDEAFNVGRTSENYQIRDLAEIVASVVPDSTVSFAEGASADTRDYRVNCDKILDRLPTFRPEWTAERGAKELYEAYQRIGVTLEEFEGPTYRRIDHIRGLIDSGRLDSSLCWTEAAAEVAS